MITSKTILELYCEFVGWQGGTIHQALEDFKGRSTIQQNQFCDIVMKEFGSIKNTNDLYIFKKFLDETLRSRNDKNRNSGVT